MALLSWRFRPAEAAPAAPPGEPEWTPVHPLGWYEAFKSERGSERVGGGGGGGGQQFRGEQPGAKYGGHYIRTPAIRAVSRLRRCCSSPGR